MNPINKVHPLILAHGQTYDRNFPLILVIGREPNNKSVSNGNLGLMDFVKHSRCAFWNVGFGIFGRINESNCRQMKIEFLRRKASPLLFADSFPQGIENAVQDKHTTRLTQSNLAKKQVEDILKHSSVIQRVKLVLFSGLSHPLFSETKALVREHLKDTEITIREIPFLYPTNTAKILDSLSEEDKALIKNIYTLFQIEIDALPELPAEAIKRYEIDDPCSDMGIRWD